MMIIPFTAKTENYYFFKHLKSLFNHVFLLGLAFQFHKNSYNLWYIISPFSTTGGGFARSRRSLAEPPGGPPALMGSSCINTGSTSTLTSNGHHNYSNSYTINGGTHLNSINVNGSSINTGSSGNEGNEQQQQNIYEDIDQYQQREPPPMIAPISGVPNLKVGSIIFIMQFFLWRRDIVSNM